MIMLIACCFFSSLLYLCRVINGSNVDMPTPHESTGEKKMKSESNLCIDEINLQRSSKKKHSTAIKQNGAVEPGEREGEK